MTWSLPVLAQSRGVYICRGTLLIGKGSKKRPLGVGCGVQGWNYPKKRPPCSKNNTLLQGVQQILQIDASETGQKAAHCSQNRFI